MNENFKYAPGKPGIGTKGHDGSIGSQGLSMFFTDFDAITDITALNNRINTNSTLWKTFNSSLPDGRVYNVGDLFIDQSGQTFEINNITLGTYNKIFANLSSGGFFLPLGVNSTDGYVRFFNSNTTPKVIIDNVYTDSGAINYTASPLSIYGIAPLDFARIEYSNVVLNNRNPFSVFSSGIAGVSVDDAKAIAIVRETSGNTFRIGNLDNAGNLRNVNLTFDVSLLSQTKQTGNSFNKNTPSGAILTNYEIAANSLFDPAFNTNPASFTATFDTDALSAVVSWNLTNFTNDSNVTGTLYFLTKDADYSGVYAFDALTYKPLVFLDVPTTGSVTINYLNLANVYSCYMKISTPNGWSRNSVSKSIYGSTLTVTPFSYPSVISGYPSTPQSTTYAITSNVPWQVEMSSQTDPGLDGAWTIGTCTSTAGINGSFTINIPANSSIGAKTGTFRVSTLLGGISQDVTATQVRGQVGPELYLSSSQFNYSSWPNYTINASQNGTIHGAGNATIDVSSNRTWTITNTLPAGVTVDTLSGPIGHTTIHITASANNTLSQISGNLEFDYGGIPALISFSQEPIAWWLEFTDNTSTIRRMSRPTMARYISGSGGSWNINGYTKIGSTFPWDIKFSNGGAGISWTWTDPAQIWMTFSGKTGTGNSNTGYTSVYIPSSGSHSGQSLNITVGGELTSAAVIIIQQS